MNTEYYTMTVIEAMTTLTTAELAVLFPGMSAAQIRRSQRVARQFV